MTDNTVEIMKQWGKGKLTTSEANEELEKEDTMDYEPLRGLDSYITNPHYFKVKTDEECKECGRRWEARVVGEYGRTYFVDDDGLCPECGTPVPD